MRFTIITIKNDHQPPQHYCDFLPPGGTIGRGIDNNLVLPDDDRAISRLQAIVHITAEGECRITNRGNVTRVVLNDIPLERGRQVDLQDGDILGIDDYRLQVNELKAGVPPAAPQLPLVAAPAAAPGLIPDSAEAAPKAIPNEIWDDLIQEFAPHNPPASRAEPEPAADNLNPLTDLISSAEPLPAPDANGAGLIFSQPTPSADALFAEESLFHQHSLLADSGPSVLMANFAPNEPEPQRAIASDEQDPLALFGACAEALPGSSLDPLGLISAATPLSGLSTPAAEATGAASPAQAPALPVDNNSPPALSAQPQTGQQDYGGITLPTPQTVARNYPPPPKGRLGIDPVVNNTQHPPPSSAGGEVLQGELLQALIDGMGLTDMQPVPRFAPQNMEQLGQMLSMFSQGTVALLSSRSILKRGVKAEMTVILDEANNPFKLLPSGKTVLMQMFGSRMPGFMPPTQSVRDALVDLQAHQLGMIAGIRAIIASMLQSFNPKQLAEEAQQENSLSRLSLPASRKAALWDYFTRRYKQTAGEIEDDFHTLFGEAFLHAYDMEVNQYKDSQNRTEK
ncbi:type VI secretion system-associated FHA domain protein TagH [Pantoea sp. B65]|uniref:type VI secretion system-associated FHA domain protein TagH n=1 Tax=Pantoea sp. B65 TaxID=2813359 RepID=UPI0039B3D7FD